MEDYRDKSFWLSTMDITPTEPLRGPQRADVTIIGAGFTGLSTAYFLKTLDPGLEVTVLERDFAGYGASGRNAGFSMKLFGFSPAVTGMRFGKRQAVAAHEYMTEAVSLVQELVEELDIECDYEHTGFLRIATSSAYERRIRKEVDFFHDNGVEDITWLDRDALQDQVRSPLFRGAAWEPHSAILNPAKLVRGLAERVRALGVKIYEQTPVTGLERDGQGRGDEGRGGEVVVRTDHGAVTSEKVVLATNAYSHLTPFKMRTQVPAFTYIVLTEPLKARHLEAVGWKARQGLEDARNMVHYFRLTSDNRVLMGGSDVTVPFGKRMDLDTCEKTFARLGEDLKEIFPALGDLKLTHRWGGPVSITLDMAPALGFLGDERVLYSVGCTGHGVSLTHLNGKTLAELALGRESHRTGMFFVNRRLFPWPPEPVRLIASQALRGYFHLEDRVLDP